MSPKTFQMGLTPRILRSPYYEKTVENGVAGFSVYNHMLMPTGYGDLIGEYHRLMNDVSMWDVAVERQVEMVGPDAHKLAQYLVPRDLTNCRIGQGMYVPVCDFEGGMLNDPVLLRVEEDKYWLSIADGDYDLWAGGVAAAKGWDVKVHIPDVSPLAIQGPKAEAVVADMLGEWVKDLRYFAFKQTELEGIPFICARSGWSKQGGFEFYLQDGTKGAQLWDMVAEAGKKYGIAPGTPNNFERIESGLLSYRSDMDRTVNPFEIRLGKYVNTEIEADFVGKAALAQIKAEGPKRLQVGLKMEGSTDIGLNESKWPVLRNGKKVGHVTSAVLSPKFGHYIAISLVETNEANAGGEVEVVTHAGTQKATITSIPFK
ncbi:MAG: dimethylsulfoniopropionate demethylase [Alphaproteobacteria bacterium]